MTSSIKPIFTKDETAELEAVLRKIRAIHGALQHCMPGTKADDVQYLLREGLNLSRVALKTIQDKLPLAAKTRSYCKKLRDESLQFAEEHPNDGKMLYDYYQDFETKYDALTLYARMEKRVHGTVESFHEHLDTRWARTATTTQKVREAAWN